MANQSALLDLKINKFKSRKNRMLILAIVIAAASVLVLVVAVVVGIIALKDYASASNTNSVRQLVVALFETAFTILVACIGYRGLMVAEEMLEGYQRSKSKLKKLLKRRAIQNSESAL